MYFWFCVGGIGVVVCVVVCDCVGVGFCDDWVGYCDYWYVGVEFFWNGVVVVCGGMGIDVC